MDFKGTRERFLERMHVDGFRRAAELAGETGHAVVVVGDAGLGPCLLYTAGLEEGLSPCREFRGVRDVRTLGAIGVVEVDKPVNMAALQDFFVERGVWAVSYTHLDVYKRQGNSRRSERWRLCVSSFAENFPDQ